MDSPAGWYPQPDGQFRYWDGQNWTDHFAPGTPPNAVPNPMAPTTGKPARPWFKKKRFILPIAGVIVIIIAGSLGNNPSTTPTASTSTPSVTAKPSVPNAVTTPTPKAPAPTAPPAPKAPAAPAPPAPAQPAQPAHPGDFDGTYGTFTTFTKTGHGAATIRLPKGGKAGLVTATHRGSSNFQVSGLDASNQPTTDGLVNAIGAYSGTTAYGLTDLGAPPVKLQVVADGNWTIKIAPISSAPSLRSRNAGKGDKVFKFEGDAVDVAISHRGQSNFMVQQYGGDPSAGVNEIGNYSGTVPFVAGPNIVVIGADGKWTLKQVP
jgi:hypothetical protein